MSYHKLSLGTVQFGLRYGISNQLGQVKSNEVSKILDLARANDIRTLDTAIAYGESESVLGKQNLHGLSIITKLPALPEDCTDVAQWVDSQIDSSLSRLKVFRIAGLLLHRPSQLLGPFGDELYQKLHELKQQGIVQRVGISVYSPGELDALCNYFHFDLVQAPFNILDRRMLDSGWLARLQNMGTALHVRSVFMQGLLLMSKEERPKKFAHWDSLWSQWHHWLNETGQKPVEACIRYALSIPEIEKVVVGVDSYSQLQQIIRASSGACITLPEGLSTDDPRLLNPSSWNDL